MSEQPQKPQDSLLNQFIRSRYRYFIVAAVVVLLLFIMEAVSADETKPGAIRVTLMENPVQLPSNNVNAKVIRVTFPPKFKTPVHTHDGPGPRYVVKGQFEVTQDGKVEKFSSGEVFWESGKAMQVQNLSAEPAELIIFEMAPGS